MKGGRKEGIRGRKTKVSLWASEFWMTEEGMGWFRVYRTVV